MAVLLCRMVRSVLFLTWSAYSQVDREKAESVGKWGRSHLQLRLSVITGFIS
jgi:hypothetical protein